MCVFVYFIVCNSRTQHNTCGKTGGFLYITFYHNCCVCKVIPSVFRTCPQDPRCFYYYCFCTPGDHLSIKPKSGPTLFPNLLRFLGCFCLWCTLVFSHSKNRRSNELPMFSFCCNKTGSFHLSLNTRRISYRKELLVFEYAVCARIPGPAFDTLTLTEPSALVSVFCQSAKLEARVGFSYSKTSQRRSGYKSLLAFVIFVLSRRCVHCHYLQSVLFEIFF